MQKVLEKIQQKLTTDSTDKIKNPRIRKVAHAELVNEYEENHKLLSAAFPYLFPWGLTKEVMGTATDSEKLCNTWMSFYDHRCAEE